jgi:hypothetical protein
LRQADRLPRGGGGCGAPLNVLSGGNRKWLLYCPRDGSHHLTALTVTAQEQEQGRCSLLGGSVYAMSSMDLRSRYISNISPVPLRLTYKLLDVSPPHSSLP